MIRRESRPNEQGNSGGHCKRNVPVVKGDKRVTWWKKAEIARGQRCTAQRSFEQASGRPASHCTQPARIQLVYPVPR